MAGVRVRDAASTGWQVNTGDPIWWYGASSRNCYTPPFCFLTPKIVAKIEWGPTLRGRQMQVGYVKSSQFRRITHYNSKKTYKIDT